MRRSVPSSALDPTRVFERGNPLISRRKRRVSPSGARRFFVPDPVLEPPVLPFGRAEDSVSVCFDADMRMMHTFQSGIPGRAEHLSKSFGKSKSCIDKSAPFHYYRHEN